MGVDYWVTDAVNDETATSSQRLCLETNTLRAEVTRLLTANTRGPDVNEKIAVLLKRMQATDAAAVEWFHTIPEHWRSVTIAWEDHVPDGDFARAEVYPGRVDVYRDFWIASVVNMVRVSRIALQSTIVRCVAWICAPADYRTTPEYAAALRVCTELITDIIASVPYHLGWHLKRPEALRRANLSGFGCGDETASKSLPGYFLNMPLVAVQNMDCCTDSQRTWVRGRLRYVASELGIRYSGVLAKVSFLLCLPPILLRSETPAKPNMNSLKFVSPRCISAATTSSRNPTQSLTILRRPSRRRQRTP